MGLLEEKGPVRDRKSRESKTGGIYSSGLLVASHSVSSSTNRGPNRSLWAYTTSNRGHVAEDGGTQRLDVSRTTVSPLLPPRRLSHSHEDKQRPDPFHGHVSSQLCRQKRKPFSSAPVKCRRDSDRFSLNFVSSPRVRERRGRQKIRAG